MDFDVTVNLGMGGVNDRLRAISNPNSIVIREEVLCKLILVISSLCY